MAFYKNGYSVNSRLDKATFLKLRRTSKRRKLSMSHIIRESLDKNPELNNDDAPEQSTGKRKTKKTANH